jgi:Tol biopolymer transport system component
MTYPLSAAAWSPDGKKIAAIGITRTQRELVIVDVADGREQTMDTGRWADITGIAWLPDSTGIITTGTTVDANQQGQVFLVSYPAGEIRKITNDLNNYLEASVTSDGRTIATIQSAGFSNLWSVVPGQDGSDKELTHGAQQQIVGMTQIADGRLIYGTRSNGKLTVWEQGPSGDRRQLSPNEEMVFSPSASKDGKVVIVSRVRDAKVHVARLEPDGSALKDLTSGPGESRPLVSPDGTWFLYTADDGTIMRMPTAGGTPVKIADLSAGRPDISPDGNRVLLSPILQITDRASRVFVVVPANGGAPIARFNRDGITFNSFSPAGDAIDYVLRKDGVDNIWRQPIAGGEPKQLTKFTERFIASFTWRPDGKTLLVNRGDTTDDVVLISDFR